MNLPATTINLNDQDWNYDDFFEEEDAIIILN
jgi:hypothetical protein